MRENVYETVIGAQWGDEGKGKVVDVLLSYLNIQYVVRVNGGPNAGHTVVAGGKAHAIHNLPVGILHPNIWNIVGPSVACDLDMITKELATAKDHGSFVFLDRSAPILLPLHRDIDNGREALLGGVNAIGTTGTGVGPCLEGLTSRRGPRLEDLKDHKLLRKALEDGGYYEERQAVANYLGLQSKTLTLEQTVDWGMQLAEVIIPRLEDTRAVVENGRLTGANILFEGAQGVMLDLIQGAQPYCTSSFCTPAAVTGSFGNHPLKVLGVAKAYTTRVGAGPFPTELESSEAEALREKGKEFGTTTERPRRCGWLDLVALRYACRQAGIKELVLTKLDILSGYSIFEMCINYEICGAQKFRKTTSLTRDILEKAQPVYRDFAGWQEDITSCRKRSHLPANAQTALRFIEDFLKIPIIGIGVGPDREQMIWGNE